MAQRSSSAKARETSLKSRVSNVFGETHFHNTVRVGRASIVLKRNAHKILDDAHFSLEETRNSSASPRARKSLFEHYELGKSFIKNPTGISDADSKHWTVLIRNLTTHHDMDQILVQVRASKLRAMALRKRLIKAVRRLILQRAVAKMKKRVDEYNQTQRSRQSLLKLYGRKRRERRENRLSHNIKAQQSFQDAWRSMQTQNQILTKWMREYQHTSTVWSLFSRKEIDTLFKTMKWEIKVCRGCYVHFPLKMFHFFEEENVSATS